MLIIILLLLVNILQGDEMPYRIDPEAVKWAQQLETKPLLPTDFEGIAKQKEEMKKQIAQQAGIEQTEKKVETHEKGTKCAMGQNLVSDPDAQIYVFLSFSLPDEVWVSLSKEIETRSGVLVLRGLPNNSFKEFSCELQRLQKLGVRACIQINPLLFRKYAIQEVPCFVTADKDEKFDKVLGNVSLSFAIEKMATQGETIVAKELMRKL